LSERDVIGFYKDHRIQKIRPITARKGRRSKCQLRTMSVSSVALDIAKSLSKKEEFLKKVTERLIEEGKIEEAVKVAQALRSKDASGTIFFLINELVKTKQSDKALLFLRKIMPFLDFSDFSVKLFTKELFENLLHSGKDGDLLIFLDAIPLKGQPYYLKTAAKCFLKVGKTDIAMNIAKKLEKIQPVEASSVYSDILEKKVEIEQYDDALQMIREIKEKTLRENLLADFGRYLLEKGDKLFEMAEKMKREEKVFFFRDIGKFLGKEGKHKVLLKLLEGCENTEKILSEVSEGLLSIGRIEDALAVAEKIRDKIEFTYLSIISKAVNILVEEGKLDEAFKLAEKTKDTPFFYGCISKLFGGYVGVKNSEKAREILNLVEDEKEVENIVSNPSSAYIIAKSNLSAKEVLEIFEKLNVSPHLINLIYAYRGLEKFDDALTVAEILHEPLKSKMIYEIGEELILKGESYKALEIARKFNHQDLEAKASGDIVFQCLRKGKIYEALKIAGEIRNKKLRKEIYNMIADHVLRCS